MKYCFFFYHFASFKNYICPSLLSLHFFFPPQPFLFCINYSQFYATFPVSGFYLLCLSLLMCIPTSINETTHMLN